MRIVALTILTTAVLGLAPNNVTAEIPWQGNLRSAHTKAQQEGKLLLLHFYSDNCVWCDRLEEGSYQDPTVAAAISKGFVPVKVHASKNPKLTEMFKVSKFPTDVIVTTEGTTLLHTVSPQQPDRYVAMLAGVASSSPKLAALPASQKKPAAPAKPKTPAAQPTSGQASAPSYAVKTPKPKTEASSKPEATKVATTKTNVPPATTLMLPPETTAAPPAVAAAPPAQTSQFTLPGEQAASGTQAKMAAARSEGLSLNLPGSEIAAKAEPKLEPKAEAAKSEAKPTAPAKLDLAMQGYCPVTVINEDRWVEGNPKLGVIHLGKLYLFADADKMQTFLADPVPFTPVLNEIDVVRFFEERVIVPGKREWGLKDPTYNRMFFFADEAAMNHFWNEYERYTGAAIEVMEKAIKEANPGT